MDTAKTPSTLGFLEHISLRRCVLNARTQTGTTQEGIEHRSYVKDKGRTVKIEESPDFAYFLGVILGDSCISEDRITFTPRDAEFRARIIENGKKIVGKEPRLSKVMRRGHIETVICFYSSEFLHALQLWLNFTEAPLGTVFGSKSHNPDKRAFIKIYEFIQKSGEIAKLFIEGFYDSEGSCHQFKRTRLKSGDTSHLQYRGRIRIYNTNKELLRFIQTIMLDFFKIESRIYLQHHKEVGTFWSSNEAQPFIKRTKDVWVLCITKRTDVREFARSIYSCIPRKNFNLNI